MTYQVYEIDGGVVAVCASEREAQDLADLMDPNAERLGVRPSDG